MPEEKIENFGKGHGYPWDLRTKMGEELWDKIHSHPKKGPWQRGFVVGVISMINSASHPDGNQALQMVAEDVERACQKGVPPDVTHFALDQVYEWRKIALKVPRGDGEITRGEITPEMLKDKLRGNIPQKYFDAIFSQN